jgi:hypothetical protein
MEGLIEFAEISLLCEGNDNNKVMKEIVQSYHERKSSVSPS